MMSYENLRFIFIVKVVPFGLTMAEREQEDYRKLLWANWKQYFLINSLDRIKWVEETTEDFPNQNTFTKFLLSLFFLMDKMANESISSLDRISEVHFPPFLYSLHLTIIHAKIEAR